MNSQIVCIVDQFAKEHKIAVKSEMNYKVLASVDLEAVPQTMLQYGQILNINHFHLMGNKSFMDKLVSDLHFQNKINYADKYIEVEVN